MPTISSVWYWSLPFLPFTAALTLILTLIICTVLPNNAPSGELPHISELGTGDAHVMFVIGFILLLPQMLMIIIGRLQLLIETQTHIPKFILYFIHVIPIVSGIFMLIMAIVSVDSNQQLHLTGAYGMFILISVYLLLHTILILYLWLKQRNTPKHARIFYFLYYLACTILLVIFFCIWLSTSKAIPEYLASVAPFLYFIGFVPQFWARRRYPFENFSE